MVFVNRLEATHMLWSSWIISRDKSPVPRGIHVCLLSPNTTDRLQPMDISVNKPAKDLLKRKFEDWYSGEIMKQLEGSDIESGELQPIILGMPVLKELEAKWMVEMAISFGENPQIIDNGLVKAGVAGALDGHTDSRPEENEREDETVMSTTAMQTLKAAI